ncbi:MAG: amidohydrolase family protein [Planctomycetes bacterium]|nr:amidohydrolase family protein [Planctomycetota bacterium]
MKNFLLASTVLVANTFLASFAAANDAVPGAPQAGPIALVGATIHPVVGDDVANGVLVFDAGKITFVGTDEKQIPKNAKRVDLKGKHLYPGLFDADTEIGLVEIQAVRATVDDAEVGEVNPSARAVTAFNPDSELIPVTRSNGVLTAVTCPRGGLLCGLASVMRMDGWTWEEMSVRTDAAMIVEWPLLIPTQTARLEQSRVREEKRAKALEQMTNLFASARAYQKLKQSRREQGGPPPDFDARWEAMLPVLEGKTPLHVRADDMRQIQSAVALARKEGVRLVIVGGYHAPECAELLRAEDVSVVVKGTHRLPRYRNDPYDTPFTVPTRLYKAGIKFCISASDRMANVRNLPYHAATAVAHGLPADEALKSITLYPAQIMGVDKQLGSLEVGKNATLMITSGDPLEIDCQVEAAYIDGRAVDRTDRHKQLRDKYLHKYEQQDAARKPE